MHSRFWIALESVFGECQHHGKGSSQVLCTGVLGSLIPLSGTDFQTALKEVKLNHGTQF